MWLRQSLHHLFYFMLYLATELFFVCELFLVSNAVQTCLDKTLLIVNNRKAEVKCPWRISDVRGMGWSKAWTDRCCPLWSPVWFLCLPSGSAHSLLHSAVTLLESSSAHLIVLTHGRFTGEMSLYKRTCQVPLAYMYTSLTFWFFCFSHICPE